MQEKIDVVLEAYAARCVPSENFWPQGTTHMAVTLATTSSSLEMSGLTDNSPAIVVLNLPATDAKLSPTPDL